jgi:hypothetical protein
MAGTIVLDAITDGTGNTVSGSTVVNGSPKAWGSYAFVGAGSTPTLRSAFNISSITRNSTGNYTFAFTTAMPNVNYSCVCTSTNTGASSAGLAYVYSKSTASFIMQAGYVSSTVGNLTGFDGGVDFTVLG